MTGHVIKLVVDNPIISHDELAAQDFKAEPAFNGRRRQEAHERMLIDLGISSRMAIGLLGKSKSEILKGMRAFDAEDGKSGVDEVLDAFDIGIEVAETMLSVIQQAKSRYMIALANVYDEDGKRIDAIA
jgi:hypothetical protein